VLFVGLLESAAWYFYRLTNNNYGEYSTASLFVVVFIANVRKTLVHVLVLLLAMGIGSRLPKIDLHIRYCQVDLGYHSNQAWASHDILSILRFYLSVCC
jgi:hypothetical protein